MSADPIRQLIDEVRADESHWLLTHEPQWRENPFAIKDISDRRLFTGYKNELKRFISYIVRKDTILVTGLVGIGKTSIIKYSLEGLPTDEFKYVYIHRPPPGMKDFLEEVLAQLGLTPEKGLSTLKLFKQIVDALDDSADNGLNIILVIDELGDASARTLQWIRTMLDTTEFTLITSGPPETLELIQRKHFPLADRIYKDVVLAGFSNAEVFEFINRRVRFACTQSDFNQEVGGVCSSAEAGDCSACISPFTRDAIDEIFSYSGGTPRAILKISDDLLQEAIIENKHIIDIGDVIDHHKRKNSVVYNSLSELQKKIVAYLFKVGQANSKQISGEIGSPVNSTLNQLNEMMDSKVIERSGKARGYEYRLTPEIYRYLQKGV